MQITFNLPHAFGSGSLPVENAYALKTLLECLINLNMGYLKYHKVAPLYQSGVRYDRTTIWDTIPALYARKYGDCKSLTAALVAQYRMQGIQADPVFRFRHREDGGTDYHILLKTPQGWEDPSKILGMGRNENRRQTRRD